MYIYLEECDLLKNLWGQIQENLHYDVVNNYINVFIKHTYLK